MKQEEGDFYADSDSGDEWATPQWIWKPLAEAIGGYDLDPAAGCEPQPIAENWYTEEDDGLAQDWYGHVWLNPPYGRKHNKDWAEKAFREVERERVDSITALVPASTSTNWWQQYYGEADRYCFIGKRVSFIGMKDDGATFANVICVFGKENLPKQYFMRLDEMGTVVERIDPDDRSLFDY